MKRAEIEKLFDGKLVEGADAKTIVDAILDINGKEREAEKLNAQKAQVDELEKAKAEAVAEALKPYQVGGEKYMDIDAYNKVQDELTAYKERDTKIARDRSIDSLLAKCNFDSKATRLLHKAVDDYELDFDENNKITNEDEIAERMKTDYADFVIKTQEQGFVPAQGQENGQQQETDPFIEGLMGNN